MLGVVPVEVLGEVGHGLAVIQEPPRVFRGAFGSAGCRFDEGVVVRLPRAGEQRRHAMVSAVHLVRLGLHMTAAIVNDHRANYGWFKPDQYKSCGDLVELENVSMDCKDPWSMS